MNTPAQTLRVVFTLSALACSVILVLFVRGRAAFTTEFWVQLGVASVALCAAICFVAFRGGRLRLGAVSLWRFVCVFLRTLAVTYIVFGISLTAFAMVIIYAVTRSPQNSLALAVIAGLWLSLWIAPGIASFTTWRKLREPEGTLAKLNPTT